jgi:hypothetical protein
MKKIVTALILTLGLSIAAAPQASAAKADRYVTKAEFRQAKKGMPMKRVHRIFDISGKQTIYLDGFECGTSYGFCPTQTREYRTKSKYGTVYVDFERKPGKGWVVTGKMAFWG